MAKDKKQQQNDEYSLKDYVYINIGFWLFLCVVALGVFLSTGSKMDPVMQNVMAFIFLVIGGGFTLVSVFDFLYDKIAGKKNESAG